MQLLLSVQEEEWDEIELAVRQFQNMTQAIKFCHAAGGGRAVWHVPGRRRRNFAARCGAPATCGTVHGTGGGWRGVDPRRRRMQGDASANHRSGFLDPPGCTRRGRGDLRGAQKELRDHCEGDGFDLSCGSARTWVSARFRLDHDEPRPACDGCSFTRCRVGRGRVLRTPTPD